MNAEQLLRGLGASGKLKGFHYADYMIQQTEQEPTATALISKRLYPAAAKRFGTSVCAVERDLRTLIRACWEQPDHTLLETVAGTHLYQKPTNSEFLDMTAAYLRQCD